MPTPTAMLELSEDESLDPIRHDGDVRFCGAIRSGRVIEVGGHLTIEGDVHAARFSVGRSMKVIGVVRGGKACTVGGDLRCQAIVDTNVVVRGDVLVQQEITASRVTCAGRLDAPDAVIVGSDIAANGGVNCHTLGDPDCTPTDIEAGVGRMVRLLETSITKQIEERRQREEIMRASIEPLMSNLKALTPAQREKTTEMLYEADTLAEETTKLAAAFERRRLRTLDQAKPRVVVNTQVHSGVSVVLDATTLTVDSPLAGPLTLTCRKTEGVTDIVSIDASDGAVTLCVTTPTEIAA